MTGHWDGRIRGAPSARCAKRLSILEFSDCSRYQQINLAVNGRDWPPVGLQERLREKRKSGASLGDAVDESGAPA
jgi:hypothetical protein